MKQENWEEQLRNQLADYEEAAPEDLWADIEAQMAQPRPVSEHRASIISLWGKRVAVAAAFVGVIMGGGYLLNKGESPMESTNNAVTAKNDSKTEHDDPATKQDVTEHETSLIDQFVTIMGLHTSLSKPNLAVAEQVEEAKVGEPLSEPLPSVQLSENQEQPQREEAKPVQPQQLPSEQEQLKQLDAKIAEATKKAKHGHVSFSLYAQNGFGNQQSVNGVLMSPQMAANYDYSKYLTSRTRGSNELIYLANYEERQKHYQPISFGLTTNIPISSRLSLTTGIVYTRLRSDFVHVMAGYPLEKEQTLQYLGVPLSAQYLLWDYKGLKVYASAGGQVDYNTKAKLKTEGLDQDIRRDRMQFSMQGALGVEYDIIPQIGLYVEPGVKHYFNNGGNIDNFFKDKPTNFNLQLGVRLNLGGQK